VTPVTVNPAGEVGAVRAGHALVEALNVWVAPPPVAVIVYAVPHFSPSKLAEIEDWVVPVTLDAVAPGTTRTTPTRVPVSAARSLRFAAMSDLLI
jgi:hypothetical protein